MKNIFVAALFLASCNAAADKKTSEDSLNAAGPDTVVVKKDSLITLPPAFNVGFYQGMAPCADCPGVQHTLLLDSNNNYILEEIQLGKNVKPKRLSGKWDRDADTLQLYRGNNVDHVFHISYDTLHAVKIGGKSVFGTDAKNRMLLKRNAFTPNTTIMNKVSEGIDFYAIGNEPFWNLEIDMQKLMLFKLADWPQPVIVPIPKAVSNRDSVVYNSPDTTGFRVTIFNQFCSDGMSDFLYKHKVTVRYKGQLYSGCGTVLKK